MSDNLLLQPDKGAATLAVEQRHVNAEEAE